MSTERRRRRPAARRRTITAAAAEEQAAPPLVLCPHCGSMVPSGDFCGHCGAHLVTASAARRHAFAAVPSEPVVHLSLISTLFPHLAHRRGGAFRWALLAGVVAVLLLALLHLFAPATAMAVFLLPVLYLLYLYEVEAYDSEPWLLVGATMAAGALFGYVFAVVIGGTLADLDLTGDTTNGVLLSVIAIPILMQALMLAGPLALYYYRPELREPLDGMTFGAASALGFTLTSTLTGIWPLLGGPLVGTGSPVDWALRLLSWEAGVLTTLLVAVGAQVLLGAAGYAVDDLLSRVAIQVGIAVVLLVFMRLVIHRALLAEGAEHEIGPQMQCPECHRLVPRMLFCPSCGVARAASRTPRVRSKAGA
jgi:RsiW-degrading membrane proteinase PrsW (M82 family)